ncbi:type II secretion system inner membrane protein GspF [Pseudomonas gingeri]|uniref:type II secretion system inner membrane protein GspF n=1 Tax=Pseudomonas gingeri TaxID=117681 RepID=UPI0015A4D59F|nr:type II secretion system inner membrane protein GspF [Pseudomonas gingeri]NWE24711.1 type II secretion system inner membrane protein GspF [Pseudomonas gingeri]NWE94347.1 type II secretion system inner membrane protein GspF [Pseudomonas gingeri]
MPTFEYHAQDAHGRRCRGQQQAESARHARQLLRERGLLPTELKAARSQSVAFGGHGAGTRLGAAELALLTLQLSTLIQAGLPLEEALLAVAVQSEKRRAGSLLAAVRGRVMEGYELSSALAGFPRAFPELFRATLAAGERSGHLGQVLEQLAHYTEARQQSRQKIQLALVYPLILLLASLGIVGFLLGYVVPDVVRIFIDGGRELPLLTRGLISLSDGLRDYALLLLSAAVGLVLLLRAALSRQPVRPRWHAWLLRAPLAGGVLRAVEAARFASTLAILCKSAVPLVEALEISATVIGNLTIRGRMLEVARSVREGGTLTRGLEQSGDIPPLMLHMIASGERAGELDSMLARAAEQQEKTLAARIALVVSLFEPAMLVVMGGVVLLIVMAILLPILSLNQMVN